MRLGDDQRRTIRGDRHAVREGEIARRLPDRPVRGDHGDLALPRILAAHHVVADAVDEHVAPAVGRHLVPRKRRDGAEIGVEHELAGRVATQESLVVGRHHEQVSAGQEVDAERERVDRRHHGFRSVGVDHQQLARRPVRQPQPSVVPTGRLPHRQSVDQNRCVVHVPLLAVECLSDRRSGQR